MSPNLFSADLPPIEVQRLVILDENGELRPGQTLPLSDPELLRLYRLMLLSRLFDDRMLKLQRQGRIGTFPPTTGQEAVSCASAFALGPKDWLVPTYREAGARLVRGEPLLNILLYYKGFEEGSAVPAEKRILPFQVVLGSQAPHAVGLAYAARLQGEAEKDTAVLTYFGDGASSEGDVHEALNFAGVWKAPVVFIAVNNQFAISTPLSKQTAAESFALRAAGYGFPGVQVDGNDPLAVYAAVRDALERAKRGEGPTLIEALTYRLLMHTTADDPTKYRDEDITREMWSLEPLIRTRKLLEARGLWDAERQSSEETAIKAEIEEVVQAMEALQPFPPETAFDHVFAERPAELDRQRRAFVDSLDAGGSHA